VICYYLGHFKKLTESLFESNKKRRVDMAVIGNISNFFQDLDDSIEAALVEVERASPKNGSRLSLLGNNIVTVLDTSYRKAIAHYPKAALAALVVCSIAAVLLFPFSLSLVALGASCFIFYKYEKRLFSAINIYNEAHCSEWTADPEVKKVLKLAVEGREVVRDGNVLQTVGSFLRRAF
jgi:hypothetical protein